MRATSELMAPAERLAAVLVLPKGTEIERAMLGLLADVSEAAFDARDRGGREAATRTFYTGAIRAFDTLVLDADKDDVRAAFGWAIRRMSLTLEAIAPPESAGGA